MAKNDEISSTERLLDLIRKQGRSSSAAKPLPTVTIPKIPFTDSFISKFSLAKNIAIGIEIGYTELKLAKITHLPDGKYELSNIAEIPFAPNTTPTSDGFIYFLKDALNNFCGNKNKCVLWSVISSVHVETRCIRIPKLPKKQIPNAVFWVFTKEVPYNKNQEVLDFKILGDITEDGITKMEVMAYTAPQKEIFELRDIFSKAGHPLTGISIVPFAVQNLLQTVLLQTDENNICNLFIGRDWSRIAIYSGGKLILSRGIKSGMYSMILCISEAIKTKSCKSAQLSLEAYRNICAHQLTQNQDPDVTLAQKIFFSFINGSLPKTRVKKYNILSEDQVLGIIRPALERLIRQIERTLDHYTQHFRNDGLAKVMVSGPLTANDMIISYLGQQLDLPVAVMDPFAADSIFAVKVTVPDSFVKREVFVPAIGMGLSNNVITPNFLFTHTDRNKERLFEKVTFSILAASILFFMILAGVYFKQNHILKIKETHLEKLAQELSKNSPEASKDIVLKLYSQSKKRHDLIKAASYRFAPVSFLEELSELTPANIRLINFETRRVKDKPFFFTISIEGIIFGNRSSFESTLTSFMLSLKGSPLFSRPAVINKQFEFYENKEVLRFSAKLEAA